MKSHRQNYTRKILMDNDDKQHHEETSRKIKMLIDGEWKDITHISDPKILHQLAMKSLRDCVNPELS